MNDDSKIQMCIVLIMGLLLVISLIIDGAFGERVFGTLMVSFGLILGYFFRKANENKTNYTMNGTNVKK